MTDCKSGKRYPFVTREYVAEQISQGKSIRQISREIGCAPDTIGRIVRGESKKPKPADQYINKKFGDLLVISKNGTYKKHARYLCLCDCGTTKVVTGGSLKGGNTTSCGCKNHRIGIERVGYKSHAGISATYWSRIRAGANNRNLTLNITPSDAWAAYERQGGMCAYSALAITIAKTSYGVQHGEGTASLDRIDSSKGYEIDNIQWVHKDVNNMKSAMDERKFIYLCSLIASHRAKCESPPMPLMPIETSPAPDLTNTQTLTHSDAVP